jgi:DNA-binding PadR family transcriptional regulator
MHLMLTYAMPERPDPRRRLPLTEAVFHVLLALAGGERHGYGIIQDVTAATAGGVTLRTGTLYTILKRLLEEGFILESNRRPGAEEDDERRRYYALTPFGRGVVEAEAQRLEQMVKLARARQVLTKPAKTGQR